MSLDFSAGDLQGRKEWHNIFKVMKGKNPPPTKNPLQPRIPHPARCSFRFNGEIKNFIDKKKLREFRITRPALQQMLNEILSTKKRKAKTINKKITNEKAYQKMQTIKVGNHLHTNDIKTSNCEEGTNENIGNAFEIKDQQLNLIYMEVAITKPHNNHN